jgi:caspase 2
MMTEITSFSRHPQHVISDMCVVAILSHGDNGLIFAKDGRQIPNEWLLRQFNNEGCPALKGKPKFFILQACR